MSQLTLSDAVLRATDSSFGTATTFRETPNERHSTDTPEKNIHTYRRASVFGAIRGGGIG